MTAGRSPNLSPDHGRAAPRIPSLNLVVDANIILSVILGRRSRPVFELVVASRTVLTSARVVEEVGGVCQDFRFPAASTVLAEAIFKRIDVIDASVYVDLLDHAGRALADAVASRNGSPNDAHLLACAWTLDADIWSHDRDFAGTGWPSWSNANLSAHLGVSSLH